MNSSSNTSESAPVPRFSSWKPFCHQRKILLSPHLIMWTFTKLNALRGWEPISTKEKFQTPLFSAILCFLENRHWAMENVVKVVLFLFRGKTPFLSFTLASHTWQGKEQLSEKSLVQNPAKLSVELASSDLEIYIYIYIYIYTSPFLTPIYIYLNLYIYIYIYPLYIYISFSNTHIHIFKHQKIYIEIFLVLVYTHIYSTFFLNWQRSMSFTFKGMFSRKYPKVYNFILYYINAWNIIQDS